MAFITLAGTLRDSTSELAVGDQIRFTHKSTTGETVEGAVSVLTIDPSGTYSKDLQYGLVLVEYKDVRTSQFKNLGVATVNGSNPATSIPELLNALVPVSSAELIEFQAILADAVTARNEAEAFAASIDLINDLSQTYTFKTVALMKSSVIVFPVGKKLSWQGYYNESDGGSNWGVVASGAHTDDGGSIFTLIDGKYIEANLKGNNINTAKFGTSSALSDNADFINNAITYAETLGLGVVTIGSAKLRVVEKFSEARNGVTIRYAIKIKSKVRFTGSRVGELLYSGTGADVVSNQFVFISNDTVEGDLSGFYVDNIRCINDGLALAYVGGVEIFGGGVTKAAGWLNDVIISKIHGFQTRVLIKFNHDRSDGVFTIKNINVSKLSCVDSGSAVLNLTSTENGSVTGIDCDASAFDIVTAFHTKGVSIKGITGSNISENLVLIECQLAGQAHSDLNISDVVSTSGKMTLATSNATTSITNVKYFNIQCPTFIIDNSNASAGLVSGITIDATIKTTGGKSRSLYINNASDIRANLQVKGSPTLSSVEVVNSDNIMVNGDVTNDTNVNCLVLQQARKTSGKVSLRGGLNGVYLKGTGGSMGGVELEVDCSGQSGRSVDYDSVTSSSHKVHIWGSYDDQDIIYGQAKGSLIELQKGIGADLTVASDSLPRPTNEIHYVSSETGVTDNVQSISGGLIGQKLTLGAISGTILTVKHAVGGGNIRTLSSGDVIVTNNNTITLLFNGTNWTQT